MAFTSLFKAVAFLAAVAPIQAFTPTSNAGVKTVCLPCRFACRFPYLISVERTFC
jgi:hypothetical protein